MTYLSNILVGFNQWMNTWFGGAPDETISARAFRCGVLSKHDKPVWRFARVLIDGVFFWEKHHCQAAYHAEQRRQQLPSHYRINRPQGK